MVLLFVSLVTYELIIFILWKYTTLLSNFMYQREDISQSCKSRHPAILGWYCYRISKQIMTSEWYALFSNTYYPLPLNLISVYQTQLVLIKSENNPISVWLSSLFVDGVSRSTNDRGKLNKSTAPGIRLSLIGAQWGFCQHHETQSILITNKIIMVLLIQLIAADWRTKY